MEVTFINHSCFRLRAKDVAIVTDPFTVSPGAPALKLEAQIVTVSHGHLGHNNPAAVSGNPRVLTGPGEYEIKGVLISGVATYHDAHGGRDKGLNTVYVITVDDLRLCHLGDLGHVLTTEQVDEIGTVDVLFIPSRGNTIDTARAAEVVSQIEPTVIIPMHYDGTSEEGLASIEKFCHEMGLRQIVPQPRLTVTRSSLPSETQVLVLEARYAARSAVQ